ncbi:MAG: LysR family transcriptional regulator [Pseudomonadota bacterium]
MDAFANSSGAQQRAPVPHSPGVMFEMLRSFTTLASTLNLSRAVIALGSTRQTVRRHIQQLEELRGEQLFEVHDRQYVLTEAGSRSVREAEMILSRTDAWIAGHKDHVAGLARVMFEEDLERPFYAQQHPVNTIWQYGPPLIRRALQVWVEAQAQIEHPAMQTIDPYLVAYRKFHGDWLCVRIGEQSAYATWLGSTWARSAIGRSLHDDKMRSPSDEFVAEAYDSALLGGQARYDHVATCIPRQDDALHPYSYQRLLLGCRFPDGQPALVGVIARTRKVILDGIQPERIPLTADEHLMEFEI